MLRRKSRAMKSGKIQKEVVVINKYSEAGTKRIRLISYDKGPWEITISDKDQPFSQVKMTKSEFKEMLAELRELVDLK